MGRGHTFISNACLLRGAFAVVYLHAAPPLFLIIVKNEIFRQFLDNG